MTLTNVVIHFTNVQSSKPPFANMAWLPSGKFDRDSTTLMVLTDTPAPKAFTFKPGEPEPQNVEVLGWHRRTFSATGNRQGNVLDPILDADEGVSVWEFLQSQWSHTKITIRKYDETQIIPEYRPKEYERK